MSSAPPSVQAADAPPELNPRLDRAALAKEFARAGRIHIPNVLTEPSALRLFRALQQETPWTLTLNKGPDFLDIEKPSPEERSRLAMGAFERARAPSAFQYFFDNHRLSRTGEPYADPNHYLGKLVAFMNAPHFLTFARELTGMEAIARTDAQATLYRPGDFLTMHDDKTGGHKRLAAYVLNMTPAWRPDWGGILQFIDARGHIAEGYAPCFNALNVFRVPALHAVSQVALYGGYRYSVTGWFHAR
ncbi:MAG TPA: 2OG-Fe(II) oxygenase family protein [Micropepsaceae bacterium]|jgi:Rps23 Pro-64 3,4-dihydroxylase Tpa1-like proline 4-hydroxylase|nr:2OG-Fe(II) oxygenase family protein [Micropepsaceae bacterium]